MNIARLAYANARVRAHVSGLKRRGDVTGPADPRDLVACYRIVLRSYPEGQELFLGLLRLREVENIKLAWRAHARRLSPARWSSLWRSFGDLETVALNDCIGHTSLQDFVRALDGTPYGAVLGSTLRAHPADLAAAEFALDRWASATLLRAAEDLPRGERGARSLTRAVVRERDVNLLGRGVSTFGLSADAVLAGLVIAPEEATRDELLGLATWTVDRGPLTRRCPRAWRRFAAPADWDAMMLALKRWRRAECGRAFLHAPYCLAPGVALVLLKEEELIAVAALTDGARRAAGTAALPRALAASALEGV